MKAIPSTTRYSSSPAGLLAGLLFFLPLLVPLAVHAEPVVSKVNAIQKPGTQLVDIWYNLSADTATVKVSVLVSADGGTNWNVPAITFTGDYGLSVTPGAGKRITWNAAQDWPNQFSANVRVRVVGDDGTAPPAPVGFALIPAGAFQMGDSFAEGDSDERPVHTVTVSAFYMAKTELSNAQWDTTYRWAVANGYGFDNPGYGKAPDHPVQTASWFDAVKWCNARSQQDRFAPCYTVGGAVYKTGQSAPVCDFSKNGYRLPTEAEWEKAARGGLSSKRFPWGDTITHSLANYRSYTNYTYDVSPTREYHPTYATGGFPYIAPVGAFAANAYELFDMTGNAWEWCWDWYSSYTAGAVTDPRGATLGSVRVYRGGEWFSFANASRAANRGRYGPPFMDSFIGFRLARGSL